MAKEEEENRESKINLSLRCMHKLSLSLEFWSRLSNSLIYLRFARIHLLSSSVYQFFLIFCLSSSLVYQFPSPVVQTFTITFTSALLTP